MNWLQMNVLLAGFMAALVITGCDRECRRGTERRGAYCYKVKLDGAVDDNDSGVGGDQGFVSSQAGTPAVAERRDPATMWMCMKNSAGACTSCTIDSDCSKQVCEQGVCMECRESNQCAPSEQCTSNRCVPDRRPSAVWTSGGGGLTEVNDYKLQVTIGAPQPAGRARASGFTLTVGAEAPSE